MAKASQNILLIGATGFTGKRVLHALAQRPGHTITCLVRERTPAPNAPDGAQIVIVRGNLDDKESLKKTMVGKDGMIYAASLGFGHAEDVVSACEEAGLKRAVFTSTTAIFTQLNAPSKIVRMAAEEIIKASSLTWTILRPTMIYGRKGDRNMERLVRYIKRIPVLCVPGSAGSLQQPIFVDDVATGLVDAYFSPNTHNKAYNISGKEALTFGNVVHTTARLLGRRMWILPLPLGPIRFVVKYYEKITPNPRIKEEQLLRLNEDKAFDHSDAAADFGFNPRTFEEGVTNLIKEVSDD